MKTLKKLMLAGVVFQIFATSVVSAETVEFAMHVTQEDRSESSPLAKKEDWDPAVANVLSGLGWGKAVYLRARTANNEPATVLAEARANQKYYLPFLEGYGTVGKYYKLNASKLGWLNSYITGRFAP